MIHIDWDDLQLPRELRATVEERIARLSVAPHETFTVRRVVHGYQAIYSTPSHVCATELRLHGSDLVLVVDRALELIRFVAERAEGHRPAPALLHANVAPARGSEQRGARR